MEYYDNDVSVHSVYIQTVFYGLCLIIKYILSYLILLGQYPSIHYISVVCEGQCIYDFSMYPHSVLCKKSVSLNHKERHNVTEIGQHSKERIVFSSNLLSLLCIISPTQDYFYIIHSVYIFYSLNNKLLLFFFLSDINADHCGFSEVERVG